MKKRERLPWALGWMSLGIGLTEVLFAERLCRGLGVSPRRADVLRACGMRELSAGWGLLLQPHRWEWTWSRVAGDVMDLVLLGTVLKAERPSRPWRDAVTAVVAGAALLDVYAAVRQGPPAARAASPSPGGGRSIGVPLESWRGSGLAEDVGFQASPLEDSESEESRQRMMEEAARKLGLPELKERGPAH